MGRPPLTAYAKKVELTYLCDGKQHKISLPSPMGLKLEQSNPNQSFFMPLSIEKSVKCHKLKLDELIFKDLEVTTVRIDSTIQPSPILKRKEKIFKF